MFTLGCVFVFVNLICLISSLDMKLLMHDVIPSSDDQYICSTFKIQNTNTESYIVAYEPLANSSVAHHILLFGCEMPVSTESSYPCVGICQESQEKVIFVWARGAKTFQYPPDTGMAIGGNSRIKYFVLQVHYLKSSKVKDHSGMILKITEERPHFVVDIILIFAYYGVIPPKVKKTAIDVSCRYKGNKEGYTLGFRTHAHDLSRSITGFKVSSNEEQIEFIGKGNPKWPQTFYKSSMVFIKPGDILMARCLYDSRNRKSATLIGSTHMDEMCNFYIMLVTKNTGNYASNDFTCGGNEYKELWNSVPSYSMDYDPPEPPSFLRFSKSSLINNFNSFHVDEKWKINGKIGESSGIAILKMNPHNTDYTVLVLHRGSRKWQTSTFSDNVYQEDTVNPISQNAILEIHPQTGNVLREAGINFFYLPHGIFATKDGKYIFVTDVALHQVMRFDIRKDSKLMENNPSLVLGERFVPGNDRNHFCKPAGVVVDNQGFIFVADGYCNSRVVCFSPNGTYLDEWRISRPMVVVHSITIEEDKYGDNTKNVVWVADRENVRLVGFNYDGSVKTEFSSDLLPHPIYGIKYNPNNRLIYGITSNGHDRSSTFTFNTTSLTLLKPWNDNYHLLNPHDLCIGGNGTEIFVVEIYRKKIVKFQLGNNSDQQKSIVHNIEFNKIHAIVSQINPIMLTVSILSTLLCIILCFLLIRYIRRIKWSSCKMRRYGHMYKDKEGFQPLTQDEDAADDGNSDPETEEYSKPRGHPLRKPKA